MSNPPNLLIQNFPYDTLSLILVECLPPTALDVIQPNIHHPPMLLTHVCSHWRAVALSTPRLWASLQHIAHARLPSDASTGPVYIRPSDIEFLLWWRERVGGIKPSIRLGLHMCGMASRSSTGSRRDTRPFRVALDPKAHRFLLELVENAVYLDLDYHYIIAFQDAFFGGRTRSLKSPNLQTLCIRQGMDRSHSEPHRAHLPLSPDIYDTEELIPIPARHSSLRRFYIEDLCLPGTPLPLTQIMPWMNLTHIHAINFSVTLDGWLDFIRECTSMVSGYFTINRLTTGDDHIIPRQVSLPLLQQLVYRVPTGGNSMLSPFINLNLPGLVALRLETFPPVNFEHLERILSSTPSLKELQLAPYHPWNDAANAQQLPLPEDMVPLGIIRPLWELVPKLESIHFAGRPQLDAREVRCPALVKQTLQTPWLGLDRRENRIKTLSFEADGVHNQAEIEAVVDGIMQSGEVPEGVKAIVRRPTDYSLWGDREDYDCFVDLGFSSSIP